MQGQKRYRRLEWQLRLMIHRTCQRSTLKTRRPWVCIDRQSVLCLPYDFNGRAHESKQEGCFCRLPLPSGSNPKKRLRGAEARTRPEGFPGDPSISAPTDWMSMARHGFVTCSIDF
ncbi:uncharacterized protein PgNI_01694 [Pyricularia grisea]|uniref:Uncharacterized protein n=1 Tax=Pyricularia grisea TaxID=148305 RepID=A0A6P8BLS9_PYRGI|nr:uncharacterized protein PgNI_01694 [Pyricularia grisea]TLD17595.1 hypothetical protein PgNI_01694 [Pyricularia grisea]